MTFIQALSVIALVCAIILATIGLMMDSRADDNIDAWHDGYDAGWACAQASHARALSVVPEPPLRYPELPAPYNWQAGEREAVVSDLAPGRYWLTAKAKALLADDAADEIAEARAKHPTSWAEAHADRGPWPA